MSKAKTLGGLASTGALTADSSGKVGVGTTTPSDNLHVVGSLRITGAVKDGANSAGTSGYFLSSTGTGTQWVVPPSTTLTGDITGSGTGSISTTLANSGVTAGSYTLASITVDSKGRITAASSGSAGSSLIGVTSSSAPYTIALGQSAGTSSTGTGNIAIGYQALDAGNSGGYGVAIGYNAASSATTSTSFVAIGLNAMLNPLSGGAYGVYIGESAGRSLTYGGSHVAIGYNAGYSMTSSNADTAVGYNALSSYSGPQGTNVALGANAGSSLTAGGNNIIIGENAQASSTVFVSNEITLGNASITRFRIPGLGINWTTSNIPVGIDVLKIDTISTTQAANSTTTAQIGWRTLTSQTLFGQTDGCMYTSTYNTGSMHQIFGDYRTGQVAIRGRESGTWTSWRNVLDSSNHTTYTTGPTFRAFRGTSSQTVSANSWNKVQFNTESWDTDNAFDSTTNYRFTPQKAGYYTVNVNIGSPSQAIVSIWKNGAEYLTAGWGSGGSYMSTGGLVYLNGSTDYIEGYIWTDGTSVDASATGTVFSAIWVRG